MNEEIKEAIVSKKIKKTPILIALLGVLILSIYLGFFLLKKELDQIRNSILLVQDTTQYSLSNLEEIKAQKHLLAETLKVFKNVPKTSSEEIVSKANKFELIKRIYLVRQRLKDSQNIVTDLEKIADYNDSFLKDKMNNFIKLEYSSLKSNSNLIKIIENIENTSTEIAQPEGYYARVKQYFNKLVLVKSSKDYKQEKIRKDKLVQIKKAVEMGNIASAYNISKTVSNQNKELEYLQNLLHTRIGLEKLLNEFTLSILEND